MSGRTSSASARGWRRLSPPPPATRSSAAREGSALIVEGREFTDVPFPTNATAKQVALLLCDALVKVPPNGELSGEAVRDAVSTLVSEHGAHWGRDATDPAQVTALTQAATEVLLACGLAARTDLGGIRPSPIAARFRAPLVRTAGAQR